MKDTDRDVVLAKLGAVNIKPFLIELFGRGHCSYRVARVSGERAARDPSRRHAQRLAQQAQYPCEVRRLLRADSVSLPEIVRGAPKTLLAKAFDVPTETPSLLDEIRALRAELSELMQLVLEWRGV